MRPQVEYEVVMAKDLKPGDKTLYGEVKEFRVQKPACMGTLEFGGFGYLEVYISDREKASRKFHKSFRNWFEKLGYALGYLKEPWNNEDCRPDDPDVRTIQIEENRPVIKINEIGVKP